MKSLLRTRITGLILGVLALAVSSSIVATVSSWRLQRRVSDTFDRYLSSVGAAELQIALLEQRGYTSAFILDGGNPEWLDGLSEKEPEFRHWLKRASNARHTVEEDIILRRIGLAFQQYDKQRDGVVDLYQEGQVEAATEALLKDVNEAYKRVLGECELYIESNVASAESAVERARTQTRRMTIVVSVLVAMTVGLSAVLTLVFFRQILLPLRRMLDEVDRFSGIAGRDSSSQPADELALVGRSLRVLMADVTHARSSLQQSRELLVQSEKLATVGRLAASVAHEIRNPLTAMKMWLFSIRRSVQSDAEVLQKFDLVSDEMNRLEGVVRNFLEFSRPPAHAPKPVDVPELLGQTLELMSYRIREKGVTATVEAPAGLPPAMADTEQLRQVLINLITNAADSMLAGGKIEVVLSAGCDETATRMVVVRVHDQGRGVPPEVEARIFEPFFTTKESGIGLGLCIAAQIMVRHGGRLILESSTPNGSCFAVWIPTEGGDNHAENPGR